MHAVHHLGNHPTIYYHETTTSDNNCHRDANISGGLYATRQKKINLPGCEPVTREVVS